MTMRRLPKWAIVALIGMLAVPIAYALYIYATEIGDVPGTVLCTIVVLIVGFIMLEVLLKPWFLLYRVEEKDFKVVNAVESEAEPEPKKAKDSGAEAAARGDLRARKRTRKAAEERFVDKPQPRPLEEELGEFMPGGKYADDSPPDGPESRPIRLVGDGPEK
jgi:type VI protein secretion system component VasK